MRTGSIVCLLLFIAGALLFLAQMWFDFMDAETFSKSLITLGVLFAISLATTLVCREYVQRKTLKDEGYID